MTLIDNEVCKKLSSKLGISKQKIKEAAEKSLRENNGEYISLGIPDVPLSKRIVFCSAKEKLSLSFQEMFNVHKLVRTHLYAAFREASVNYEAALAFRMGKMYMVIRHSDYVPDHGGVFLKTDHGLVVIQPVDNYAEEMAKCGMEMD